MSERKVFIFINHVIVLLVLLTTQKMSEYRWFRPENVKTIPELLSDSVQKDRNKPAIIYMGTKISYQELYNMSVKISKFLNYDLDIYSIKSHVALMMPNIPEFPICYYGTLISGRIAVPINFISIVNDLKTKKPSEVKITDEIKTQLHDSKPRVIFVADFMYSILKQAKIDWACTIVIVSPANFLPLPLKLLYSLKTRGDKYSFDSARVVNFKNIMLWPHLSSRVAVLKLNDVAQLQYTGGTTGNPKGAMLTHANLANNILQTREALGDLLKDGDEVVLGVLPFFHIYGLNVVLNTTLLCLGGTVVLMPKFSAKSVLWNIFKHKVTLFPGVNLMYHKITSMKHDWLVKTCLKSLRLCVSGAGPIDIEIVEKFKKLTKAKFAEGYGLSETSPVVSIALPEDLVKNKKAGVNLLGKAVPGTFVKIWHPTIENIACGCIGELAVYGSQVMVGYYNQPDETDKVIKKGWFRTGDIGYIDSDRSIYLIDREKDMIKVMGENIYPSKIEAEIKKNLGIDEAFIVGIPDAKLGEIMVVCIKFRQPESNDDFDLFGSINLVRLENKSKVLVFKSFEEFKSPIGKILKRKLREEVIKRLKTQ